MCKGLPALRSLIAMVHVDIFLSNHNDFRCSER
jgi:hypothetical protein